MGANGMTISYKESEKRVSENPLKRAKEMPKYNPIYTPNKKR